MPAWLIEFCTHPITLLMFGGGIGTNARYWLGILIRQLQGEGVRFPWATFLINISGSVILGLIAATYLYQKGIPEKSPTHDLWLLLLGTGFCGGFTTFSTFSLETYEFLYLLGSVGGGLLGVWLAVKLSGS
jgi:CrcB protein